MGKSLGEAVSIFRANKTDQIETNSMKMNSIHSVALSAFQSDKNRIDKVMS